MSLTVEIPSSAKEYYSLALFEAQDNLDVVKTWYPSLKTLLVELRVPHPVLKLFLRTREFNPEPTSIEKELGKLIDKMRDVDLKEKYVRLMPRNDIPHLTFEETEGMKTIVGMSTAQVASRLMEKPGLVVEI